MARVQACGEVVPACAPSIEAGAGIGRGCDWGLWRELESVSAWRLRGYHTFEIDPLIQTMLLRGDDKGAVPPLLQHLNPFFTLFQATVRSGGLCTAEVQSTRAAGATWGCRP